MSERQNIEKKITPNLNDLEIAIAIIDRDTTQYRKERLDKLILELQSKTNLTTEKPNIPKQSSAVNEDNFTTLKFEPQEGTKLGDYEVTYKQNNLPDKWQPAYNILRINNSVINDRYHGEGYQYSYWLYGEGKIYRQKLKPKENQ
jgi:hypothetical protein